MNKPQTNKFDLINADALEQDAGFQKAIDRDFAAATDSFVAEDPNSGVSRRRWLQLMGASLALGGAAGCRFEEEKIAPFAFRPQNRVPGVPEKFASVIDFNGVAQPLLSTCIDGRPIKLDGNPDHPDTNGASTVFTQSRILELYDPDRLRGPMKSQEGRLVESTVDEVNGAARFLAADSLADVAILAEPNSSPSLAALKKQFTDKGGHWFTYTPVNDDNARAGMRAAFGKVLRPHYMLDKAKVIVTLDADILGLHLASVVNSSRFAKGRDADHGEMSRMYSIESSYTYTGASADHRLSVPSSKIASLAASLADQISKRKAGDKVDSSLPYREKVLAAMAQDLVDHRGAGVVVAGESQSASVHALVHSINQTLGNHGKTVLFTETPDADQPEMLRAIEDFRDKLKDRQTPINAVLVIGGNPVYDAPVELGLDELLNSVRTSIHLTESANETSLHCTHVSNAANQLESWTDSIAYDGSICIGQPLIRPLFGGRSVIESLTGWMELDVTDGLEIINKTMGLDDNTWSKAVHDGFVANSAAKPAAITVAAVETPAADNKWLQAWDGSSLEAVFCTSRSLFDGRHGNNAWLYELPDFFTKISWDNVASMSPRTANDLSYEQGRMITVKVGDNEITLPVAIQPGQADGTIALEIGYGRTMAGRVGGNVNTGIASVGVDVGPLRSIDNWNYVTGVTAIRTGKVERLAVVQEPWQIDQTGRNEIQARMFRDYNKEESDRSALIREGTFDSYKAFMSENEHADHDHASTSPAAKKNGSSLPVLTNVSTAIEDETTDDHATDPRAVPGLDKHRWPEAFHLHHQNIDITPGAREDYRWDKTLGHAWGMSIDLNKCTGCNSCVIACQAENNIPVVGKAQVWRGREMHWLRIDRYYGDNLYNDEARLSDDKQIVHQPVTCHHCENAPCETVCPVAATTHSSEGLNDMVYNRCIGTRYCGNNCPYKVRRFNYLNYSDATTFIGYPGAMGRQSLSKMAKMDQGDKEIQNLMMNPEVTIRSRGVMEKCTYCIQRISLGKIKAKNEGRELGPNEITTACQDACPTQAIYFGDLKNTDSNVRQAHDAARAYTMLEELNNHPRTKYLARVRNPHPALVSWDDRDSRRGGRKAKAAPESESAAQ